MLSLIIKVESDALRSQFGTLKRGEHAKYIPMVFTEQGVAMLSSIFSSQTAIKVNIQIIRIFTKMREMLLTHKDLLLKIEQLEKNAGKQDERIQMIFDYLKQFIKDQEQPRKIIGFKPGKNN